MPSLALSFVSVASSALGGIVTAKFQRRHTAAAKLSRPAHRPELVGPGLDRLDALEQHDMDHHAAARALPRLGLSLASTISIPRETISVWLGGGGHSLEPATSRMR